MPVKKLGHRYQKGNPGGPGNPFAKRCAELRAAIYAGVSDDDMRAIIQAMIVKAKKGDVFAAREIIDRLLGKAKEIVELSGELDTSGTVHLDMGQGQ